MGSTIPRTPYLAATHFHAVESNETANPGAVDGGSNRTVFRDVVFLFFFIAWYALSLWRGMRRRVWCFAFTGGFVVLDDPAGDAVPVRWGQVTAVGPVWTQAHDPVAEEPRTVLGGYCLRTADGQAHEISCSLKNVEDPYHEMGQVFRALAPATIGTTMPTFPTIDQVIAAYAGKPAPGWPTR